MDIRGDGQKGTSDVELGLIKRLLKQEDSACTYIRPVHIDEKSKIQTLSRRTDVVYYVMIRAFEQERGGSRGRTKAEPTGR